MNRLSKKGWVLLIGCLWVCVACAERPFPTLTPTTPAATISEQDGMVLVYIPAGPFLMGSTADSDPEANEDEIPQRTVTLDAYWIDQTEVTVAQYGRCVAAGVCAEVISARETTQENFPAQGITWDEAQAYCQWVGRRLPTEAEWEKAARGENGRIYPWGNEPPDETLVNFDKQNGGVAAVGSYPAGASPYGVLDMAGNVWEWTADWYDDSYYTTAPAENPTGPEVMVQKLRVLRGGDWTGAARTLRTANRFWGYPGRNDFDGFRCAMDG